MSASLFGRARWGKHFTPACSIGVLVTFMAQPAYAQSLDKFFADPLGVKPPVLDSGAVLPGEASAIACPVNKDFSLVLRLTEAVDLALCNNPQIDSTWAAIQVQSSALGEARATYLPTLSVTSAGAQNQKDSDFVGPAATRSGQTYSAILNWRVFDFGGRSANNKAATSLLTAALAEHDATLQKVITNVVQSYFDAQTAKALFIGKEQAEDYAKKTLLTAQRKTNRGAASEGEFLQVKLALSKATIEKTRAYNGYLKALAVLIYALGVPAQTQVTLADDDLAIKDALEEKNVDAWLQMARQSHPAIAAARHKYEAANQKVLSARSEGLPIVDFSVNYSRDGMASFGQTQYESRTTNTAVTLTVPLFDGFSRSYKTRGALAMAEQAAAELRNVENNILLEVVKTHADAATSVQRFSDLDQLRKTADSALASVMRRYEKGAADIVEVIVIQNTLSDAQTELIQGLAELRSAKLRLLASTGLIGRRHLASVAHELR